MTANGGMLGRLAVDAAVNASIDVLLLGPYPPPTGGVSIHVQRVAELASQHGLQVAVCNHFKQLNCEPPVVCSLNRNPLRYWRAARFGQAHVIHYHHSHWLHLAATAWGLKARTSTRSVITVHAPVLDRYLDRPAGPLSWMTRRALEQFDAVIAVSPEIATRLSKVVHGPVVVVVPAYVPPQADQHLRSETAAFLRQGSPTVIISAYRFSQDHIYSFDLAIEAFAASSEGRPSSRLAIFVARPPQGAADSRQARHVRALLRRHGVEERSLIVVDEPLVPAFAHRCVFIRPTTTDGDSIGIREALAAGVPVLASDVVPRPQGTIELPLDSDMWIAQLKELLQAEVKLTKADHDRAVGHNGVIDVYRRLLDPSRSQSNMAAV